MRYEMKPIGCDPARLRGLSEKLIVSHYENNYGGAVKRLNAINAQLGELSFRDAPGFVINGLNSEAAWVPAVVSFPSFILMFGVTLLELLVAAIQAYVFALLTSLYLNDAINLH